MEKFWPKGTTLPTENNAPRFPNVSGIMYEHDVEMIEALLKANINV